MIADPWLTSAALWSKLVTFPRSSRAKVGAVPVFRCAGVWCFTRRLWYRYDRHLRGAINARFLFWLSALLTLFAGSGCAAVWVCFDVAAGSVRDSCGCQAVLTITRDLLLDPLIVLYSHGLLCHAQLLTTATRKTQAART